MKMVLDDKLAASVTVLVTDVVLKSPMQHSIYAASFYLDLLHTHLIQMHKKLKGIEAIN